MSITIQDSPAAISLAGNPVAYQLRTDNQYSSSGSKAKMDIALLSGTLVGQSFTLSFLSFELEFTCANPVDESGLQFLNNAAASIAAQNIYNTLVANYLIEKYFNVTIIAVTVTIESKENGDTYDISFTNGSSPINVIATPTAGTNDVLRDFFKIGVQLFFNSSLIGEDRLPVDDNGDAVFDISKRMLPELQELNPVQSTLDFPATGGLYFEYTTFCKEFYIKYFETFGNPPVAQQLYTASTKRTYFGGLNKIIFGKLNALSKNYFDNTSTKRWLTWEPDGKVVGYNDYTRLFWWLKTGFTLPDDPKIKVVFFTGPDASIDFTIETMNTNDYSVYEIVCTCSVLVAQAGPTVDGDTITHYKVYIENDNGKVKLTDEYTFYIDRKAYENDRHFIYRNSFGVWGTIRTTGIGELVGNYDRQMTEAILDYDYTNEEWQDQVSSVVSQDSITLNTGWLDKSWRETDVFGWADFFNSTEVYEIQHDDENDTDHLIPVVVTSKKIIKHIDKQYLRAVLFDIKYTFKNEYHSEDVAFT